MTHKEFQEKIKSISDEKLIIIAKEIVSKLCSTGGQSFIMRVPPTVNDSDIVLSEIIKRFEQRITQ